VVLEVEGLTRKGVFRDVSFSLRAGEIVGLAGLVGAGRSEVARAIFGVDPYEEGTVRLNGAVLPKGDVRRATARGLALVPEDRRKQGLVLDEGVSRNITLAIRSKLSRWGLLRSTDENRAAREWASRLEVKTAALDATTGTLSGGNQQKVVIGKWLATEPTVLIVDEPTRGIDVGTKSEVHRLLSELAQQGLAILMISSELPEVLGMADRVLVMREGRLTGEFARADATPEAVMYAATAEAGASL
jgi:rhamnose transport system ATP-binding protein